MEGVVVVDPNRANEINVSNSSNVGIELEMLTLP